LANCKRVDQCSCFSSNSHGLRRGNLKCNSFVYPHKSSQELETGIWFFSTDWIQSITLLSRQSELTIYRITSSQKTESILRSFRESPSAFLENCSSTPGINNLAWRQPFIISLPDELRDPACGSDSFKQFLKTILFSL